MEIIKCNEQKRSKMNKYDPDYIKLKFTYNKNKHIFVLWLSKLYNHQNSRKIYLFIFIISYSAYVMVIMMHNAAIKKRIHLYV